MATQLDLTLVDTDATTTSLQIAKVFERTHKNVLQSIGLIDCSAEFNRLNFQPIFYTDKMNRQQSLFKVTRDGFAFLAMSFTGAKAAKFKEVYIQQFNAMEALAVKQAATINDSQRFLLERFALNAGCLHPKYFDVFHKSFEVMNFLVANGFEVNSKNVPDISIGIAAGKFWEENTGFAEVYGDRVKIADMEHVYPESCPQSKSYNKILPWCYPGPWLPTFEGWLKMIYMTENMLKYLATKVNQRHLTQDTHIQITRAVKQVVTISPH